MAAFDHFYEYEWDTNKKVARWIQTQQQQQKKNAQFKTLKN